MLHYSRRSKANLIASSCLLIFAQPGASDDWTAEFVFPATTGYVMHNMDVMEVSYKSNYPNASLWCFCYNGKEDPANLVIMGVYKNAKPLDGYQDFQFDANFASDFCWYNLRNLDNEEKGLNGKPEMTAAPSTTADAPASTSATATSAPPASSAAPSGSSSGAPAGSSSGASAAPTTAGQGTNSATQTGGGGSQTTGGSDSSSASPKKGSDTDSSSTTTKPTAGESGSPPLNNSTVPLIGNGTMGGGESNYGAASPALSSGVIAGIVVGAVLGVLGILGFLGALWLVKRHRKGTLTRQSRMRERESKSAAFGTHGRFEVDGKSLPGELCGDNKPDLVELPG
ncbi:hypothetical protein LEL_02284 [Akanthomyces lecanii RCEF 1005]|uniref:Uncharacterized protein n=1 Tax=Akanthomyces lecanii RCEF 1005 TaxID=1081108 RepID=A0A162KRK1_CORDF|nr:hypothetical protein LEL_02284 [Akanthomyces lecanii RCEF 1005]